MMKKTLLALSVAGAFIGTASAAPQIELYGLINTGFSYVHSDSDLAGEDAKDSFSMETGKEFGSRWGIRGSEDLGNGLKVSFTLESGFASDTGASEQSRLFGRESHVDLSGSFGTVSFGLMPIFGSVLGANGLFRAIDPLFANYTVGFGSGHATASMWTRVDNAVSYRTPTFAGLTGYAMYSFKNDSVGASKTGEESKAESDRYASLALRYLNSNFEAILVADTTLYGSVDSPDHSGDGVTVTLGGNYTFGNGLKMIVFGQYFKDQWINTAARAGVTKDGVQGFTHTAGTGGYGYNDGWGASVGVNYPMLGGVAKAQIAYRDMENSEDYEFNRWFVALGYDYSLSKRTSVYAMAGYTQEKIENRAGDDITPSGGEFTFGLLHRF